MCLGVPGRVVDVDGLTAIVDFWGIRRETRLDVIDEEVSPGDYILNHVGFAIRKIPAEEIVTAARAYATTEKAGIYYTLGITEHTHGTENVYCLANLVLMTGHLGKKHAGMNPLRGQNNVQGANDAGASPVFYPGYQRVTDPEARVKFEEAWGVPLSPDNGLNLNEMMKTLGKGIKAVYVMGEDIVLSEPNVSKLEEGLNDVEFLVLQDIFLNETARFADVILPAACFAEKDGTFTNSERRVQRVRKGVEPPGDRDRVRPLGATHMQLGDQALDRNQ